MVTHGWHKRVIMHGPTIAKYYIHRGTAIIDIFSVVPFIAQVCDDLSPRVWLMGGAARHSTGTC